ncbi:glycosyltransferase [Flagellimonas baculiformis]|uniref:glycosyltransferase n=1 Tax=Flagellimonas baculiformis TaxID=3067310 RepID=UPI00296F7404|nr:glycosyltransferase [Muricauda sp. D6]
MRILHIANSLHTGGAEKLLLETIPRLNQEKDMTVDLLLLCGDNQPFLSLIRSLNANRTFCLSKNRIYDPFFIFKILPYLKKYDIVHVHLFPSLYWAGIAKFLSFSKVKMVYTEHNTTNRRRKNIVFKYLDRLVYANFRKIITISPDVDKNIKIHLGAKNDSEKFVLIPNGVNIEAINSAIPIPKSKISPILADRSKVILQVSSFTPQKDQKTVIKALQLLPENYFCCFVGDGPTRDECRNLVNELGLNDRVIFLGIRTDVYQLLKSVDFIVLSSHFEGLSLACIEGMASGKPFIASNVPGLGNIVMDAGLLFPEGDSQLLAEAIKNLEEDTELNQTVVQNCQKRAMEYDIGAMVAKTIDLYGTIFKKQL